MLTIMLTILDLRSLRGTFVDAYPFGPDGLPQVRCPVCGHFTGSVAREQLRPDVFSGRTAPIVCACARGQGLASSMGSPRPAQCACSAVYALRPASTGGRYVLEPVEPERIRALLLEVDPAGGRGDLAMVDAAPSGDDAAPAAATSQSVAASRVAAPEATASTSSPSAVPPSSLPQMAEAAASSPLVPSPLVPSPLVPSSAAEGTPPARRSPPPQQQRPGGRASVKAAKKPAKKPASTSPAKAGPAGKSAAPAGAEGRAR